MGLDQKISDFTLVSSSSVRWDRGEFDKRRLNDIRGVAVEDIAAVIGEEYLHYGQFFYPSGFAHEFFHLVHQNVFSDHQLTELANLFAQAIVRNNFLNDYQSLNVYEYAAEGYRAFMTLIAHPQGDGMDRQLLKQKDSKLK